MPEIQRQERDRMRTRASLLEHVKDLGNEAKWREFYDTYSDLIFFVARKRGLGNEDAEDLTQDIFITLAQEMPNFHYDSSKGSFKGWLLTLVRNRTIDYLRKPHRRAKASLSESDPSLEEIPDISTETQLNKIWEEEFQKTVFTRALQNLQKQSEINPHQYQLLDLVYIQHLRPEEVARRLDIKRASVDTTVFRKKDRLKDEVDRLEKEFI